MSEDADRGHPAGRLIEVSGAVVRARSAAPLALNEVVYVGEQRLLGEVIALDGDVVTIQVYEETAGLAAGASIEASGGGSPTCLSRS